MSTTITTSAEKNTDLTVLAGEINAEHEAVQVAIRDSVDRARRIGEMLNAVKAQLDHGQFTLWLTANVHFSERTARGYMRIARNWATLEKTATVADLPMRDALKLLTDPRPPIVHDQNSTDRLPDVASWVDDLRARLQELEGDADAKVEDWIALAKEAGQAMTEAQAELLIAGRRAGQHLNELDAKGIALDCKIKKRSNSVPFIEPGRKYIAFDGHDNCIEIIPHDDPNYVYAAIYRMARGENTGAIVDYMKRGIATSAVDVFIDLHHFSPNELGWMSAPHDGREPWYIEADREQCGGAA